MHHAEYIKNKGVNLFFIDMEKQESQNACASKPLTKTMPINLLRTTHAAAKADLSAAL